MSISLTQTSMSRVQREIGNLRDQDAHEAKKASDAQTKLSRIAAEMGRASPSRINSLNRDAERQNKVIADASSQRAKIADRLAQKHRELSRYEQQLRTEQDREGRKAADRAKKQSAGQEKRIKDLEKRLAVRQSTSISGALDTLSNSSEILEHDVFISHASEDKNDLVRALAAGLEKAGLKVWYDEFSLKVGDSLRREIDKGLSTSRFGLVVLSPSFFAKQWSQHELDGLVQLELAGRSRILPVWHNVSVDEVRRHSPTLADKVSLKTSLMSVDEIVAELVKVIR